MGPKASSSSTSVPPKRTQQMIRKNLFDVEAVIDQRVGDDGHTKYLVKWDGYEPEDATWEPRRRIPSHFITEWNKTKAELDDLDSEDSDQESQDDQDFSDEQSGEDNGLPSTSNSGEPSLSGAAYDTPEPENTLPRITSNEVVSMKIDDNEPEEAMPANGNNGNGEIDDNDSTLDAPGEVIDLEEVSTLWPPRHAAAPDDQPTDLPAEIESSAPLDMTREYCDDPSDGLFGFIHHTDELRRCNNPRHLGGKTNTCSACFRAAVRNLNELQRDAYNRGAFFKVCLDCTNSRNPQGFSLCICRDYQNCSRCLHRSMAELATAKLKVTQQGRNEAQCYHCQSDLNGLQWKSQCAYCDGMKLGVNFA